MLISRKETKLLASIWQFAAFPYVHLDSSEGRKTLEEKFIFQIDTLDPHGINECFSLN